MAAPAIALADDATLGVALIRRVPGLIDRMGKSMTIARSSIYSWKTVPADRLLEVEKATGIPRELLRPDLYRQER